MIDWSKYTPHEIRLALESAPKVAGPWRRVFLTDIPHSEDWRRCGCGVNVNEPYYVAQVWCYAVDVGAEPCYSALRMRFAECDSISAGKAKADAALREAGWILDDEGDQGGVGT